MKENNQDTLKEALSRLPVYQAPEGTWEKISQDLESVGGDPVSKFLKELPVYEAPEGVWNLINNQLRGKKSFPALLKWGIAASVLLMLAIGLNLILNGPTEEINVPPIAEKKSFEKVPEVIMAEFENEAPEEEARLKECLAHLNGESIGPELKKSIDALETLTLTRDSLSNLLISGKGLPGTSPRLDRLDLKRKDLIGKLLNSLCENR